MTWQAAIEVVVGGMSRETDKVPDVIAVLNSLYNSGASLGGNCGETLALARAGLLDSTP